MAVSEQRLYDQIEQDLLELPVSINPVEARARLIQLNHHIIKFRGRLMISAQEPYYHYVTLNRALFDRIGQESASRSD